MMLTLLMFTAGLSNMAAYKETCLHDRFDMSR